MPPIEFKLSKRGGITRRITFPDRPTWVALSARISELYDILLDDVAVSYVDSDGDEVTLDTEEELFHFLATNVSKPVKLFVQDLSALRSHPGATAPADKPNPFGLNPSVEEEWQIPHFDRAFIPEAGLHASRRSFIEDDMDSDAETTYTQGAINVDKGKARASIIEELAKSSPAGSVVSGDVPPKHPIHVYDVSGLQTDGAGLLQASTPALAESTPRAPLSEAGNQEDSNHEPDMTDDPPLPPIEPQTSHSPSLSHDIANLISSFGNVISSHPELSEGFRNVFRNASDGTYWRAHRTALSKAAEEISQVSGTAVHEALDGEVDAGRKVWHALDVFFRSLSEVTGAAQSEPKPPTESASQAEETNHMTGVEQAPISTAPESTVEQDKEVEETQTMPPKEVRPAPTDTSTEWRSFFHESYPLPPSFAPPPPPPPHNYYSYSPFGGPPRHPFWAPPVPPSFSRPPHMTPPPPPPRPADLSYTRELNRSFSLNSPSGSRAEATDKKAKVQAAKSMYRAEKARYLQEREQVRQRLKDKHLGAERVSNDIKPFVGLNLVDDTEQVTQNITHAPSPSPVLSIPGFFPPQQRRGPSHDSVIEDFRSRAVKRICRQLADMGFTENQHPGLAEKVKTRLPDKGSISKDVEDGIVTNLLEELLPLGSPGPIASGSRMFGPT